MTKERRNILNEDNKSIAIIVGTRPQIIKSAPVLEAFKKKNHTQLHNFLVDCSIINTGQHYDYEMNRRFFKELDLPEPEVDLEIGRGSPNEQVSRIISKLDEHFRDHKKPDLALIPGDTNSALAAGIACSKLGIKIGHLESGCRSNDMEMSEEINRRVLDHISQVLLCPTALCAENLRLERVQASIVENVGDTMLDSLLRFLPMIEDSRAIESLDLDAGCYAFMTMHRAENVDSKENLAAILRAMGSFGIQVVFAIHPRTREMIKRFGLNLSPNIRAIDPLGYFDTLRLQRDSKFVITDSGGVQKEAYWLHKPSLVLRDQTEWREIVGVGASLLVGKGEEAILDGYERIQGPSFQDIPGSNLFGNGRAAEKVVDTVVRFLNGGKRQKEDEKEVPTTIITDQKEEPARS